MFETTGHFEFNQNYGYVPPQGSGHDTYVPPDTLYGGKGHDKMHYGSGTDTVHFGSDATYDPDAANRLADEYRVDDSGTYLDPSFFG